jgi:hypothetical protein
MEKALKLIENFISSDEIKYSRILKKLKEVYTNDFQEKEIKFQNFRDHLGYVKPRYKRSSNCPIPWIDGGVWKNFQSSPGFSYPKAIRSESVCFTSSETIHTIGSSERRKFKRESERSTSECIDYYTTRSRQLSIAQRRVIGLSGLQAARSLSIVSESDGRRYSPSSRPDRIKDCVEGTAKNTNSGFPFFKRKNSTLCIEDTKIWIKNIFNNPNYYSIMKNPLIEMPTTLFYRVQPSVKEEEETVEVKIRQVWGIPQRIVALEYYFFKDILSSVYENNIFGNNPVYSSGLTNYEISLRIINRLRNLKSNSAGNKDLYSMDYSKFDRTIPNYAIDTFYAICRESLDLSEKDDKIYNMLRFYIKHTPFIHDDKLFVSQRGIPSGSYITNLIDTWWNLTLWNLSYNLSHHYKQNLSDFLNKEEFFEKRISEYLLNTNFIRFTDLGICGDDSIAYTDHFHIKILENLCDSLGMKITTNVITTESLGDIYFLGRKWDWLNRPIQSDLYFIGHLCLRTKFYDKDELEIDISEDLEITRMLSITLQFHNGLDFLKKYFMNHSKLNEFLEGSNGFYLLKDWPITDGYRYINRIDAMSWTKF